MRPKITFKATGISLPQECAQGLLNTLPRLRRLLLEFYPSGEGQPSLTPPQYFTLGHIYAGDCLPSHLSRRLMVSMPTITSVVDGLVARGLVEREPEPSDRRRVRLNLTPAGRRLYEDYRKTVEHRLSQVLSRLTEEQQRRLLLALNDLEQVLDTPPDKEKLI